MSSSRRPWMKFYPADWRADQALRICSLGSRGLWIECMAIMHEADPYGYLTINGKVLDDAALARLVGSNADEVEGMMQELETAGVFSRNRHAVIYSRRMIRDEKRAKIAREVGKTGGNPSLGKQKQNSTRDNPPVNRDGAEGVNLRSKKLDTRKKEPPLPPKGGEADFDIWYEAYPRHVARGAAEKAYRTARKIADAETLLTSVEMYRQTKPDYADWKHPATWLTGKCWLDETRIRIGANGSDEPYLEEYQEDLRQDYRRLKAWVEREYWDEFWGAKPGEDGCAIDKKVMALYGPGGSEMLTRGGS